jgi:8-oxo-dGTP diphosphatase
MDPQSLRYSSCLIRHGDRLLMVHRRYEPNAGKLNVVGGKIEPGETPAQCAMREVLEETGIRMTDIRFTGIVTWNEDTIGFAKHRALGMYMFGAEFPADLDANLAEIDTPEGALVWRDVSDVLGGGQEYVDNLPFFLRPMLDGEEPADYHCQYSEGRLVSMEKRPLPEVLRRLAEM